MALYWVRRNEIFFDTAGFIGDHAELLIVPVGLDDTLRRTVADVWFELSNVDPDWVNNAGGWGVEFNISVLHDRDLAPDGNRTFGPVQDTDDGIVIWSQKVPGESFRTTETGVEIFRFPSGGGACHVDTPAQRIGVGGGVGVYFNSTWATYTFSPDTSVTHLRSYVAISCLFDSNEG